jgi:hypothetical protein
MFQDVKGTELAQKLCDNGYFISERSVVRSAYGTLFYGSCTSHTNFIKQYAIKMQWWSGPNVRLKNSFSCCVLL